MALPRAPAAAALAQPLRVGPRWVGIDTRPLCRACCDALTPATAPVTVHHGPKPLLVYPAFETDDRILAVIHALKFSRRERLAPWLARSLALGLPARALLAANTVLVPIPMDRASLRRRGFNQAERIARAWASMAGIALVCDALVKTRATVPQSTLGGLARVHNVAGVMAVRTPTACVGKRVVLVDDLVTTGATAAACAAALWRAGVADVSVACVGYRP